MTAPAVHFDIRVQGLKETLRRFGGIEARAKDLRPAYNVVADLLEAHTAKVFQTQGLAGGPRWKWLVGSTVRARSRRWGYYGRVAPTGGATGIGPILGWSGRLRQSFARGNRGHVRRVSRSNLTWGSSIFYGKFHDSTAPRRVLPRRSILRFRDQFQRREITLQPIRLHVLGVEGPGAIASVLQGRLRLGALGRLKL